MKSYRSLKSSHYTITLHLFAQQERKINDSNQILILAHSTDSCGWLPYMSTRCDVNIMLQGVFYRSPQHWSRHSTYRWIQAFSEIKVQCSVKDKNAPWTVLCTVPVITNAPCTVLCTVPVTKWTVAFT